MSAFATVWFSLLAVCVIRCTAVAENSPFFTIPVGDFKLTVLSDGAAPAFDLEGLVLDVQPAALAKVREAHFLPKPLINDFNVVYLDTGDHKVIFDTGSSDLFGPSLGKLLESMGKAGLNPEDVDTVIITHAHPDHVGGVVKPDGSYAFPNAKHLISRVEYEYWTRAWPGEELFRSWRAPEETKMLFLNIAKDRLGVIKDRVDFFELGDELLPGVLSKELLGHTPGQSGFVLRSGDESCILLGDAISHQFFAVERPEWALTFDLESDAAINTRFSILENAANSRTKVLIYHGEFPGIGHIFKTAIGYGFRPIRYAV